MAGTGLLRAQVRDEMHPFGTGPAGLLVGDVAFDLGDLVDIGEIDMVIEGGGRTDSALLDSPVGLIEGGLRRGE